MILDVCNELGLPLSEDAISTAHRLKQHPNKTGPPIIIARFKGRDDRNNVLALRDLLKTTKIDIYGIKNLYINESLTPEKRKMMYKCKKFARENYGVFGKIFVWSFKGDIYVRQKIDNALRYQINDMKDIDDFQKKCTVVTADAESEQV